LRVVKKRKNFSRGEKPQGMISAVAGRQLVGLGEAGRRIGVGLRSRPSAPAVGQHGGSQAAGVCATEERGRTVPQERYKGIHTLPRLERGPG